MLQQVTIQPSQTPGGPVTITTVPAGVPQTNAEYRALLAKREALSDQLVSASNRRKDFAEELKSADASARSGLLARMKVLDDRIVRLETEIDRTGDLVANTPPMIMTGSTRPNPGDVALDRLGRNIVPIAGMFSVFVLFPLMIAVSRLIWKRASAPSRPMLADQATQQRLEQMQQSIDTIAIEIERISESQRYVAKMMNDGRAIGPGAAEPLRAPMKAGLSSDRS